MIGDTEEDEGEIEEGEQGFGDEGNAEEYVGLVGMDDHDVECVKGEHAK